MDKTVKRDIIRVLIAAGVLLAAVLGIRYYTGRIDTVLEKPVITEAERTGEGVALSWDPVRYTTRYDVFRRSPGGSWIFLAAVGTGLHYTDKEAGEGSWEYAVKACSVLGDTTVESEYSDAADVTK